MTKKKRSHPGVEEILARPWCYYCERDFDDLKILINHQKAKHFKCERCGRRLNTAGGLSVHMSQVHKENLTAVDNALPNRVGLEIEIFAMEGIPEEIVLQHNQRVLTQYHQAEADRRAASGNAVPGATNNNPSKKPKTEDMSDLKKRLAEHKAAKMAAESGASSGTATPTGAGQTATAALTPGAYQTASPSHPPYQQPYAPPQSTTTYGQPHTYSPVPGPGGYQAPAYGQPPASSYGQLPGQPPYQPPPVVTQSQSPFPPSVGYPPQFPPPPFQNQGAYPGQPYAPHAAHLPPNGATQYPGQSAIPPRPFGPGSPMSQLSPQQRAQSPSQNGLPQRTGSGGLPTAPGLPQRPVVGAPPVNAFQFQQMHQGQIPAQHNHIVPQQQFSAPSGLPSSVATSPPGHVQEAPNATSIDDLISSASKQADAIVVASASKPSTPHPAAPTPPTAIAAAREEAVDEKVGKKDKEKEKAKQTRMVYSDNETSPEEKMALLPKYAYDHRKTTTA